MRAILLFWLASQAATGSQAKCNARLLLFWAVDCESRTQDTVKKNIDHCKNSLGKHCCDVFLSFYAGHPLTWGDAWIKENTIGQIVRPGYKFSFLKQAYYDHLHQKEDKYDFIWVLDSDIDFSGTNLTKFLDFSHRAGTPIVGPTFKGGGWESPVLLELGEGQTEGSNLTGQLNRLGAPSPLCDVRHTDFVELTAPLVRPQVLPALFEGCRDCVHPRSDWGLDMIWCQLAKESRMNAAGAGGCALIDATPVNHLNWKTAKVTRDFFVSLQEVKRSHSRLWAQIKAFDCLVMEPAKSVNSLQVLLADGRVLSTADGHRPSAVPPTELRPHRRGVHHIKVI